MPEMPPHFWTMVAVVYGVIGSGAALNVFVHRLRRGSDMARASLWPRFWVWVAAAAILFGFTGPGPASFAVLMAVIAAQASRELAAAFRAAGWPADGPAAILVGVGGTAWPFVGADAPYALLAALVAVGLAALARGQARSIPATLAAGLYVGIPLALLVALRQRAAGFELVAWTLFVVIITDNAAMFGGIFFGRRKLAPKISPSKTIEGAAVGLAGALAAAGLLGFMFPAAAWPIYFAAAALIGIADMLGDLAASAIKRAAGLKDFGVLLPGHGGLMDRIDGLLFAAPAAWLVAPLFSGS